MTLLTNRSHLKKFYSIFHYNLNEVICQHKTMRQDKLTSHLSNRFPISMSILSHFRSFVAYNIQKCDHNDNNRVTRYT